MCATADIRKQNSSISSFFITCVKPHRNVSCDTVSRIKCAIHKAGVPEQFSANSTRAASVSSDVR